MSTQRWIFCYVLAVGLMTATIPITTRSTDTIQRTVRGTVLATNLAVVPQTIVVKVPLPDKDELIVGARVPADARITRGTRGVPLADIKAGESVELRYLKSPEGLIAQSIHVR